jgi:hypothetical protein
MWHPLTKKTTHVLLRSWPLRHELYIHMSCFVHDPWDMSYTYEHLRLWTICSEYKCFMISCVSSQEQTHNHAKMTLLFLQSVLNGPQIHTLYWRRSSMDPNWHAPYLDQFARTETENKVGQSITTISWMSNMILSTVNTIWNIHSLGQPVGY